MFLMQTHHENDAVRLIAIYIQPTYRLHQMVATSLISSGRTSEYECRFSRRLDRNSRAPVASRHRLQRFINKWLEDVTLTVELIRVRR